MKAKVFCAIVICLISLFAFYACFGSTGPTDPDPPDPPDNSKYYDLQVEYIRTEILNPDRVNSIPKVFLYIPDGSRASQYLTKIDDYHFKCEFPHIKGGLGGDYYFDNLDLARWDGFDDSSAMVGDIYIVTVKQTGVAKELKDVRPYTLSTNPYPGPKAKAAFFKLTSEGVIVSNTQ